MTTSYEDMVLQFLYTELPTMQVSDKVRFEAISAEVLGTKQRRYGPLPSPEDQVSIRNIIRKSENCLVFVVPWGCSKQNRGPLDVLEFMAIRQLSCLAAGLLRLGQRSRFIFRLEDLTDYKLFMAAGENRSEVIHKYAMVFRRVAQAIMPDAVVFQESSVMNSVDFSTRVNEHTATFEKFFREGGELPDGWVGTIPEEQQDYYLTAYRSFYPEADHIRIMSTYFAAAFTRVEMKGTGRPESPHLQVSFSKPVPGNPFNGNRIFMRTLPCKYTHQHHAPWLANGFLQINDQTGECCPRYLENEEVNPHWVDVQGGMVSCPYAVA